MLARYGEPTRDHWEADYSRTTCARDGCGSVLRIGARHHCRRCGKIFCDQCSGGGFQRRLNARAEFAPKGVFSTVCMGCFTEGNGWFAEEGSEEWTEASTGHSTDRMADFDRERKVGQAQRKAVFREESTKPLTAAWRCRMLQQIAWPLVEEYMASAAGGTMEGVGRAARVTRGLAGVVHSTAKSREHWVSDRSIMMCQQASCRRAFTMNERKHHCRVCGRVFCDGCSPKRLDVVEYALEHATEDQLPILEVLRGGEEGAGHLERVCVECHRDIASDSARFINRKRLEAADSHVLCNLYKPIPSYVQSISGMLHRLDTAISYLETLSELAEKGESAEEMKQMAAADVLEVKGELIETFRRYEERYNKILKWSGWRYAQILAEGTPVTERDGSVRPNVFVWNERVCSHRTLHDGVCSIVADDLDPIRPGEVLFEGPAQQNVEEQLRVLSSLKMHFSGFWRECYHSEFKSLVEGANRAIHLAAQPPAPSPPRTPAPEGVAASMSPRTPEDVHVQASPEPAASPQDQPAWSPHVGAAVGAAARRAVGHVLVHIIEAAELDLCGVPAKKISAYAVVGCGGRTCATHVVKKTSHPRWDQKFALSVQDIDEDLITLLVMSNQSELGSWTFGVCELVHEMGGNMQGWVVLCPPAHTDEDVDQGRIRISVKFMPSETQEEGPALVKVREVNLLVEEEEEEAGGGAVAVVRGTSPLPSLEDVALGSSGGAVNAVASRGGTANAAPATDAVVGDEPKDVDPVEQVEALTEAYVLVYILFDEVKKWQGQLDVALVLPEETQKKLLTSFTVLLEAVGSHLQDGVQAAGGQWKQHRGKVLTLIKAKGEAGAVLFPHRERVMHISGVGAGSGSARALKGVDLLSRADDVLKDASQILVEGGCGPVNGKPKSHQAVVDAREVIRSLAHKLAVKSP